MLATKLTLRRGLPRQMARTVEASCINIFIFNFKRGTMKKIIIVALGWGIVALLLSFSAQAQYDWGPEPEGIVLPAWPTAPSGSPVVLDGNVNSTLVVNGNDVEYDLNGHTINGLDVTGKRVVVRNGRIAGPIYFSGEDFVLDGVYGTSRIYLGQVDRFAIVNSTIKAGDNYPIYCSEYANSIIVANTSLEATSSGLAGFRCMGADHLVIVDSRIEGIDNAPLRLHAGDLQENPQALNGIHDVWIARTQVIGSGLGAFWINLGSGAPISATAKFKDFLIEDNSLYSTNFGINTGAERPASDFVNMVFLRNVQNFSAADQFNWEGWYGEAQYGWYAPTSGVDANTLGPTISAPTFSGGYGGSIPDPDPDPVTDTDGDGINDDVDNCPNKKNTGQADHDGDGIGNPCDPDDDNDTIPDSWEKNHGLERRDASDALEDFDGDGFTNLEEFQNGTDPNVSDAPEPVDNCAPFVIDGHTGTICLDS